MKESIISYKLAKLADDKGFDLSETSRIPFYYNENGKELFYTEKDYTCIVAPTQSLLQKWLREKYNIEVYVLPIFKNKCAYDSFKRDGFGFEIIQAEPCQYLDWSMFEMCRENIEDVLKDDDYHEDVLNKFKTFNTYEEALEHALTEALKLITSE